MVIAWRKEPAVHLNERQLIFSPVPARKGSLHTFLLKVPARKTGQMSHIIQDPITLSSMLRPVDDPYSQVSHNIQFERS